MPITLYGDIGKRYDELTNLNAPNPNWLGAPTTEERDIDGGRVQKFENGSIFWWPDLGARDLRHVSVRYKGLYAFGEMDWDQGSSSDEPYVTIGVAPTPAGQGFPMRSQIYEDVDAGDSRPDYVEIYVGEAYGTQLFCGLFEHDTGDQDMVRNAFIAAGEEAARRGQEACAGQVGPEVGDICKYIWENGGRDASSSLIDDLLGTGDDTLAKWPWYVSPKEMIRMIWEPRKEHWGITYTTESHLLSAGGGSWKIYLEVLAV